MIPVNETTPIFHLFEVYTSNISTTMSNNTTRETYGAFKFIRNITLGEIVSPISASSYRDKPGEISFTVPIYDTTYDHLFKDYDDVEYNFTSWDAIIGNQLQNKKDKTYFITTTKGRGVETHQTTVNLNGYGVRKNVNQGGFIPAGDEKQYITEKCFVPHFHGWLTGIQYTEDKSTMDLTFTNVFGLLQKNIADQVLQYGNRTVTDELNESNNHIIYRKGDLINNKLINFGLMITEIAQGLVSPTVVINGKPLYRKENFKPTDFNNRSLVTMYKDDESVTYGLKYAPQIRAAKLHALPITNEIDIMKFKDSLTTLLELTQSEQQIFLTPDIALVKSTQPGLTTGDYYEFRFDFFPANATRVKSLKLNEVDILYNTMGDNYANINVVADFGSNSMFSTGYHGYLYNGALGYPVIKFETNTLDTENESGQSLNEKQWTKAITMHRQHVTKYLNIAIRDNMTDLGDSTIPSEYFLQGDTVLIEVSELKRTFSFKISGKVLYIDPTTHVESWNYIFEAEPEEVIV